MGSRARFYLSLLLFCSQSDYVFGTRSKFALKRPVDKHGCPIMHVWNVCDAGIYRKQGWVWKRKTQSLLLEGDDDFKCHNGHWNPGNDMATCVFAEDYCPIVTSAGDSKCSKHAAHYKRTSAKDAPAQHGTYWNMMPPLEDDMTTYDLQCNVYGQGHVEKNKPRYHRCENDLVPGKGAFGHHEVEGRHIYIVGPDGPLRYHEGGFHRMFQVSMRHDIDDMQIWPYNRLFYLEYVVKVTAYSHGGIVSTSVNSTTSETGSFWIKAFRHCGTNTDEKFNVLQVRKGFLTSQYKDRWLRAETRHAPSGTDYIDLRFSLEPNLGVFVQLMDCPVRNFKLITVKTHSSNNDRRYHASAIGYPGEKQTAASFGFITLYSKSGHIEFFGPHSRVLVLKVKAFQHTPITHGLDWKQGSFEGEPMVFLQAYESFEEAQLRSANRWGFEFIRKSLCDKGYKMWLKAKTHALAISFVDAKDKDAVAVSEELEDPIYGDFYVNLGCPYVGSYNGKCNGVYKAIEGSFYRAWQNIHHPNLKINLGGGKDGMICRDKGAFVESNRSACLFSDAFCIRLHVLYKRTHEIFNMYGSKQWGSGGGNQVKYIGRTSSGRMNLNSHNMVYTELVCDNDHLPQGPVYGMNYINNDRVYVVGSKQITEGPYYRMFKVDVPADGKGVTVYPMVIEWGYKATATKLMVQDSGDGYPIVPAIIEGLSSTFRMELWRKSCDSNQNMTGNIRVNVLQVRLGMFTDPWNYKDEISANTNQYSGRGAEAALYRYAFWSNELIKELSFKKTPLLFTQIYHIAAAEHRYYQIAISDVTKSNYKMQIKGYPNDEIQNTHYSFTWIGIAIENSSYEMFASAVAFRIKSSVTTDKFFTVRFVEYSSEPLIFIQSQNDTGDSYAHAGVRNVKNSSAKIGVELHKCGNSLPRTLDIEGIVLGRLGEPRRRTFDHFINGCSDSVLGDQSGHCPFKDNYCGKVHVMGTDFHSIYNKRPGSNFNYDVEKRIEHSPSGYWGRYKNGSGPYLRLEVSNKRDFTVRFHDRNLFARSAICLRHPVAEQVGRIEYNGKKMWNASQDVIEAPETPDQRNLIHDKLYSAKNIVHVKYFQMEVQDGDDTGRGLYTYVGGHHIGTVHAYGTAFASQKMDLAFGHTPGGYAIYVKPMDACGLLRSQNVKVNVMLVSEGTYISNDGKVIIKSERVNTQRVLERADGYIKKGSVSGKQYEMQFFPGIQESNLGGFMSTATYYDDGTDVVDVVVHVAKGAKDPTYITLLTIHVEGPVAGDRRGRTMSAAFGPFKITVAQTYDYFVGKSTTVDWHFGGYGVEAPFVLTATSLYDPISSEYEYDVTMLRSVSRLNAVTDQGVICHTNLRSGTRAYVVAIGEFPRDFQF